MLVEAIGLRKIPNGTLRLIVTAPANNTGARVFISELVGPLPHIANQILYSERTCSVGVGIHIVGTTQCPALVGHGHGSFFP